MYSISSLNAFDIQNLVITALIGVTTFYLVRFYYRVRSYPPGPMPLPILGNILSLRGTKRHTSIEMAELQKRYGKVVTFWAGNTPMVLIFDMELARNAFKRNEFAGRPKILFGQVLSNEKYSDVVLADYGHRWEALRRVAHAAVRKYAATDKLAYLVSDCVEESVKAIKSKVGFNKPFVPFDYTYFIFANIMVMSANGKRLSMEDTFFKRVKYFFHEMQLEIGSKLAIMEFLPFMKIFYGKMWNNMINEFIWFKDTFVKEYRDHYKDYDENVLRDFSDALIFAKNEAINEGKESAPYLTDENLGMIIIDLLLAGIDTSRLTFNWMLLFLANDPHIQTKLRQEIESVIGDRIPVQEDRNRCHYVNAFIHESMRFRPIIPLGVFHKNVVQANIGDYTIPKDTMIFIHQFTILNDSNLWNKPNEFLPERFLENNGSFIQSRLPSFIPFGTGRRVCLGEKMAIADLFLSLVRFLQLIKDVSLENGPNSADFEPNLDIPDTIMPKDYKIIIKE